MHWVLGGANSAQLRINGAGDADALSCGRMIGAREERTYQVLGRGREMGSVCGDCDDEDGELGEESWESSRMEVDVDVMYNNMGGM